MFPPSGDGESCAPGVRVSPHDPTRWSRARGPYGRSRTDHPRRLVTPASLRRERGEPPGGRGSGRPNEVYRGRVVGEGALRQGLVSRPRVWVGGPSGWEEGPSDGRAGTRPPRAPQQTTDSTSGRSPTPDNLCRTSSIQTGGVSLAQFSAHTPSRQGERDSGPGPPGPSSLRFWGCGSELESSAHTSCGGGGLGPAATASLSGTRHHRCNRKGSNRQVLDSGVAPDSIPDSLSRSPESAVPLGSEPSSPWVRFKAPRPTCALSPSYTKGFRASDVRRDPAGEDGLGSGVGTSRSGRPGESQWGRVGAHPPSLPRTRTRRGSLRRSGDGRAGPQTKDTISLAQAGRSSPTQNRDPFSNVSKTVI